jgi:two-component system heavy metal sensor histidine kinase CusS
MSMQLSLFKSLRLRLFVYASLIVALTLSAVGLFSWRSVLRYQADSLDEKLCLESRRIATQAFMEPDPERLENDLLNKLHLNTREQLLLHFGSPQGRRHFSSANWDNALQIDSLPWKARTEAGAAAGAAPPPPEPAPPPPEAGGQEAPPPAGPRPGGLCRLASFTLAGKSWHAGMFATPAGRAFVAADLAAGKEEVLEAVKKILQMVIPLALVLSALGAWLLASLSLRPVNRLREAMKHVDQKALAQRLSWDGEDKEFRDLIVAYNTMLTRLERSFHQASRFSADAAHELKTPLTILQGRIEQAIKASDNRAIQTDLSTMLDEVARLSAITRKLLLLSHADAGSLALHLSQINLSELLNDLIADAQMLLSTQTLQSEIAPDLLCQGDAILLRQLFNNLLSNAVRYCGPGGWIQVLAHPVPMGIEIVFANASYPIPAEERQKFFERFYRGDAAHNREIDGNGLGLSLALEIAKAHSGKLMLENSALDQVRLRLLLPH